MKRSFLHDTVTGKRYDLTALVEENGSEISIGRIGYGNLIELGKDTDDEDNPNAAQRVSRKHATITFLGRFYIKDHSSNGTRVNEDILTAEQGILTHRDKIWFGTYGPLIYEDIYGVN